MPVALSLSSSRLSGGGGLGFSGALGGGGGMALAPYAGAGAGLGFGLRAGAGLGHGGGLGLGHGGGLGLGHGGGLGLGVAGGAGGFGAGLGLGLGGGVASLMMASPAFSMGRTMAAGGMSAGASLAAAAAGSGGSALAPVLSRAAEKQTLSGLNQRFAGYMTTVRQLQQENAALEARLAQLTGGADVSPDTSGTAAATAEHEAQLAEHRGKLESLSLETVRLEIELDGIRGTAHELKAKYDFEQGVKFQLEEDIAAMKRDIEVASDLRIDLDAKHSSLKEDLDYINKTQEEEFSSLQSKLGATSTEASVSMIEVDTGKSFDISSALNKMRMEYEKSVQEHREEADAYYKLKIDEVQAASASSAEALSSAKMEISSAKKELQGLSLELQTLLNLNLALEGSLAEAQAVSTRGVAEYQAQISSLEAAIEVAKGDLHKQILSYQELLDIKLALDAEIATYRSLLDGDDISFPVHGYDSASLFGSPGPSQANSTRAEDKIAVRLPYNESRYSYTVIEETKEMLTETRSDSTTMTSDAESEA